MSPAFESHLRRLLGSVRERLLGELGPEGHWRGRLSTSALSTATAVFALTCVRRHRSKPSPLPGEELGRLVARGREWLAGHVGEDGGWGDTPESPSNLPTTVLCWAALSADRPEGDQASDALSKAEVYLNASAGGLGPEVLCRAVESLYGKDKTFSVPILMMCALAGRLGNGREAWSGIPTLPFELAVFPRSWYKSLGLPVVSYALPALIAMGQTQHHHAPTRLLPLRWLRDRSRRPTAELLASIQPVTGGFLEAVPLTSFVTMSLATSGAADSPVVDRALTFLATSVRRDGSWPIDVDLATWGTTLAVNALSLPGGPGLDENAKRTVLAWLLGQQHRRVHPFTDADPGGWAWTDLPGGVPDADDTSGALLALATLGSGGSEVRDAAEMGVRWLLDLQNRDGGMPTFCRGWGALPFDRSSDDISAHALRAWHAWSGRLSAPLERRVARARRRLLGYLSRSQRDDGSWLPLWFGNQHAPGNANPTYGTSRVVLALADAGEAGPPWRRGTEWLLRAQNEDGGWGGAPGVPSTLEETALALEALGARSPSAQLGDAVERGLRRLVAQVEDGDLDRPAPIGLYFADLWYSERLYPPIFSAAALGRCLGWASSPGGA